MRNIPINAETLTVKNNVGAGLAPATDRATARVAPTKINLRWAQPTLRYLLIMISILMLFLISACGGGGGSSPTGPGMTVVFSGSSSGYNVYMASNSSLSSGSVLAIDIKVDSVSNVFGAAFDVDFDSTKMTYSSYSAGSFLETGGNSVSYQPVPQSGNSGKLIVGASRQAPSGGQSGSGTLVTLKFNVTGATSTSFSNNSLKDSSNNTISATWSGGGTVTVQ